MFIKKILIFWLWLQWKKYLNFFIKNSYEVHWVCKTHNTKKEISDLYKINVFLEKDKINLFNYDLIILALPPDIQWQKAIEIVSTWFLNKIIVEIPVSFDKDTVNKLINYENVFFFLEEYYTILGEFLRKIDISLINEINISVFTNKLDYQNLEARKVTFLHINSNFLWLNIDENIFEYDINFHNREDIFYKINFNYNWINIFYNFWEEKFLIIGEKKYFDNFNFDMVLKKYIETDINNSNFYNLIS